MVVNMKGICCNLRIIFLVFNLGIDYKSYVYGVERVVFVLFLKKFNGEYQGMEIVGYRMDGFLLSKEYIMFGFN